MKTLLRRTLVAVAVTVGIQALVAMLFRTADAGRLRGIARWNRRYLNPIMLKLAGRDNWYAASLHHIGRTSGRTYATPLVVHRVEGGIVIPLPYGREVDWMKNLMARGSGSVIDHGAAFEVSQPRVVNHLDVEPVLSQRERMSYRLFGVREFVRLDARPLPDMAASHAG